MMFLGKSLGRCALRTSDMILSAKRLETLRPRFVCETSSGLSLTGLNNDTENRSEQPSPDVNLVDDMPPKKLRLAEKVTILARKRTETIDGEAAEKTEITSSPEMLKVLPGTASKSKLNFASLRAKADGDAKAAERRASKRPLRAVVDMEMMKSELKQLEDPPVTPEEKLLSANRLGFEFFDAPSETLAKNLLGKILVRRLENGTLLKGRIVETESYLGGEDKASQTYMNKITPRNSPMYMPPGTIYVYLTYGMYHCFNISSRGDGSGVLIRALAPIEGTDRMEEFRNSKRSSSNSNKASKIFKPHELSNGPSKFCIAFGLSRDHTKHSACSWKGLWLENDAYEEEIKIVSCPRIGIDSAGPEWAMKPLRFYLLGDRSVSKIDKRAEAALRR